MEHEKRYVAIIFFIILILQVILRIYVGNKKEYFHMDEAYSYGNMNYNKLNISDNEDFLDKWHVKDYYADYFEINKNEIYNLKPIYENQKNDVHPPLYYLLLRIFASTTIDNFNKWTGLTLNIIIFVISFIFVYLISKDLFKSRIYALVTCFINGFTILSLESCLYIRMYELCNLNILIITYLHMKIFFQKIVNWQNLILIAIVLFLGGMTHYYFFIYALALYIIYIIKCINNKKYKNLIKYNICVLMSAILYLFIWPHAISHILFGYRGISNCVTITQFFKRIIEYMTILNNGLWNGLILAGFVFIVAISITKDKIRKKVNSKIILLLIPIIIYFLVVAKNSPYMEARYVMPIYSACVILTIYSTKAYMRMFWDNKSTFFLTTLIFLCIINSPRLTGVKIENTYSKYNNIAKRVEELNKKIVYIFNTSNNRFLDDAYLFTIAEESIVLDYYNLNEEKLKNILKENADGIILMMNEGIDEEKIKNSLKEYKFEYLERMNACNVYKILPN